MTDTNQASEDELRTLDEILSQAFTDGASDTMWIADRHVEIFATAKQAIQAHTNAEIAKATTAARIDEIDWCRNEVENDIPINVYDKLSDRIAQLQKEVK